MYVDTNKIEKQVQDVARQERSSLGLCYSFATCGSMLQRQQPTPTPEEPEEGEIVETEQQHQQQRQGDEEAEEEEEEEQCVYHSGSGLYLHKPSNLYLRFHAKGSLAFHWSAKHWAFLEVVEQGEAFGQATSGTRVGEEKEDEEEAPCSFCYDETSGTYYDQKTGLYYDPSSDLYQDLSKYPILEYHHNAATRTYHKIKQRQHGEGGTANNDGNYVLQLFRIGEEDNPPLARFPLSSSLSDSSAVTGEEGLEENKKGRKRKQRSSSCAWRSPTENTASATAPLHQLSIGRSRTNDIVLADDEEVSKHHAVLQWQQMYWQTFFWITDLRSKNGTYLNGVRLQPQAESETTNDGGDLGVEEAKQYLKRGDDILIGGYRIVVSVAESNEQEAEAEKKGTNEEGVKDELASPSPQPSVLEKQFKPNLEHPVFQPLVRWKEQQLQHKRRRQLTALTKEEKLERSKTLKQLQQKQTQTKSTIRFDKSEAKEFNQYIVNQSMNDGDAQHQLPEEYLKYVPRTPHLHGTVKRDKDSALTKEESKGYAMLERMGWKAGEGLGKSKSGIKTPLDPDATSSRAGLGFFSSS
ncbi:angiogenic factor with G patch and FHA domains 1 isoform X1 [Balamuthia mandrillaris]